MIINTNNHIQEFNINNVNVNLNKLEYWFIIGCNHLKIIIA